MKKVFIAAASAYSVIGTIADQSAIASLTAGKIAIFNADGTLVEAGGTPTGDYITIALGRASNGALVSPPIYNNNNLAWYNTDYAAPVAGVYKITSALATMLVGFVAGSVYTVRFKDMNEEHYDLSKTYTYAHTVTAAEAAGSEADLATAIVAGINADANIAALGTMVKTSTTVWTFTTSATTGKSGIIDQVGISLGDDLYGTAVVSIDTEAKNAVGGGYEVRQAELNSYVELGRNKEPMGLEEGLWTDQTLSSLTGTYHTIAISSQVDKTSSRLSIDTEANFVQELQINIPDDATGDTLQGVIVAILTAFSV